MNLPEQNMRAGTFQLAGPAAGPADILVPFIEDALIVPTHGPLRLPTAAEALHCQSLGDDIHLGRYEGQVAAARALDPAHPLPDTLMAIDLRRFMMGITDDGLLSLVSRGKQLLEWRKDHRFCSRCGTPTTPHSGEHAQVCPACDHHAYPRISPCIIVLVTRGSSLLLARGSRFGRPMFSTLAGFVEAGETLEEAVHREVREEVGIEIEDVRYHSSQPWPFPHSLMAGFTARFLAGELNPDADEIVEAGWFEPSALPPIPPPPSIARRLIDDAIRRAQA